MKRIFLTLVITWSLVGAPIPAVAQSPEFMAAYNSYKTLNQHGRYSEAEPFARKALELAFGISISLPLNQVFKSNFS